MVHQDACHRPEAWWLTSIIPATWKEEIRRIAIQGWPRQKVNETLISVYKLGMVVHACHSSYVGYVNRRISVQAGLVKA
jgi:hypothetical protein